MGDVLKLGSLTTRRDFTYVSDTVEGFLKAAQADGVEGQVYNLGVGKEVTVEDLAHVIVEIIGKPVEIRLEEERLRPVKSEVQRLLSDNRKARRELGWEPVVSLHEGLGQTIDWIRAHANFYQAGKYMR